MGRRRAGFGCLSVLLLDQIVAPFRMGGSCWRLPRVRALEAIAPRRIQVAEASPGDPDSASRTRSVSRVDSPPPVNTFLDESVYRRRFEIRTAVGRIPRRGREMHRRSSRGEGCGGRSNSRPPCSAPAAGRRRRDAGGGGVGTLRTSTPPLASAASPRTARRERCWRATAAACYQVTRSYGQLVNEHRLLSPGGIVNRPRRTRSAGTRCAPSRRSSTSRARQ